jgi:DNA-binding response OmpR family regulator
MTLMRDLLSTRGYDVVAVPDAAQAEAEIMRRVPDVVLSDVVMPGKSGYELCRELKENLRRGWGLRLITGLSDRVRGISGGRFRASRFSGRTFARVKSLIKLKELPKEPRSPRASYARSA